MINSFFISRLLESRDTETIRDTDQFYKHYNIPTRHAKHSPVVVLIKEVTRYTFLRSLYPCSHEDIRPLSFSDLGKIPR